MRKTSLAIQKAIYNFGYAFFMGFGSVVTADFMFKTDFPIRQKLVVGIICGVIQGGLSFFQTMKSSMEEGGALAGYPIKSSGLRRLQKRGPGLLSHIALV